MKKIFVFASFVVCFTLAALSKDMLRTVEPSWFKLSGDAVESGNLTVYPVVATFSGVTPKFITLEEGLESKRVIVEERKPGLVRGRGNSGAAVNEVVLVNNGDLPLILLAGEVITGGHQDRIISEDRIVPAHSDALPVAVFCVEPNRWQGPTGQFTSTFVAAPMVRGTAMASNATQTGVWNSSSNAVSLSSGGTSSGITWTAVSPTIGISGSGTGSVIVGGGTGGNFVPSYSVIENGPAKMQIDKESSALQTKLEKTLAKKLKGSEVVGAVVAVNGKVVWMDAFPNHDLFARYWPKLLRAYAAEAMIRKGEKCEKAKAEDAEEFLNPGISRQTLTSEPDDVYAILKVDNAAGSGQTEALISYVGGAEELLHVERSAQ